MLYRFKWVYFPLTRVSSKSCFSSWTKLKIPYFGNSWEDRIHWKRQWYWEKQKAEEKRKTKYEMYLFHKSHRHESAGLSRAVDRTLGTSLIHRVIRGQSYPTACNTHTPLQTEASFINVNLPYKLVTSILFSEFLLCLPFLKIISSK